MSNSETIELIGEIKRETDQAVLFFDGKDTAWLPKSQILERTDHPDGVEITIPDWLAIERGLV